jgi:hypothetical protein
MKSYLKKVSSLLLDDQNPRLPDELTDRTEPSLLKWMANQYNTIQVASSISDHGYFDSEPLIAIQKDGALTVVEGNRRLTALKLLLSDHLRKSIDLDERDKWEKLSHSKSIPTRVPVFVAKSRNEVAPLLGFRHISGIEPWEAWAKARFVAHQIEVKRHTFPKVAMMVGEKDSEIRSMYRNYRVAIDAEGTFGVSAEGVKNQFGYFSRAMNSPELRKHMGVQAAADVRVGKRVLAKSKRKQVAEVFSWLFGDKEHTRAIESRQVTELGKVVASPDALAVFRETRNIEEAMLASGGTKERLLRNLHLAGQRLLRAEQDIAKFRKNAEVRGAIDSCEAVLNRLRERP